MRDQLSSRPDAIGVARRRAPRPATCLRRRENGKRLASGVPTRPTSTRSTACRGKNGRAVRSPPFSTKGFGPLQRCHGHQSRGRSGAVQSLKEEQPAIGRPIVEDKPQLVRGEDLRAVSLIAGAIGADSVQVDALQPVRSEQPCACRLEETGRSVRARRIVNQSGGRAA